ncbi:hypothetical protein BJV77DRAFT_560908 [Russula vinacea]|nr:hypothetical protein BJV77DRAFT_560908 [Russula vinacea]
MCCLDDVRPVVLSHTSLWHPYASNRHSASAAQAGADPRGPVCNQCTSFLPSQAQTVLGAFFSGLIMCVTASR